jgi:hypothetical protein
MGFGSVLTEFRHILHRGWGKSQQPAVVPFLEVV